MLEPKDVYETLKANDVRFFAGVPDSLLKDFCAYIQDVASPSEHIISANEGNAVALASGHYLATGNLGCVYLQNSGLGNTINPLVSLADPQVYAIPMLLIIGWRGEPGIKDEPQHRRQGEITCEMLDTLGVRYVILPQEIEAAKTAIAKAIKSSRKESKPYALVVKKGTFSSYSSLSQKPGVLIREEALRVILENLPAQDIVVSTTGKTSREVFELREKKGDGHEKDFLTVGSMGHASSIALAIALTKPDRNVWCLDGDGAAIMHMGALTVIGQKAPGNLIHVVLNNGAHESVGGLPTAGFSADFCTIAKACGYQKVHKVITEKELVKHLGKVSKGVNGPIFIEVRIRMGSRKDLGRPTRTPKENKEDFMKFVTDYEPKSSS